MTTPKSAPTVIDTPLDDVEAAMRKDAARYRRLREEVVAIASNDIPKIIVDGKTYRDVSVWQSTTSLDAAVDALEPIEAFNARFDAELVEAIKKSKYA